MIVKPQITFQNQVEKPDVESSENLVEPQEEYREPLEINVTFAGEIGTTPQSDFYRTDLAIIDIDTIAAGDWGENQVVIFKRQWDDSWDVEQTLVKTSAVGRFGSNIAIDGTVMAIGAETDSSLFTNAGGVYIYEYSAGVWAQTHFLHPADLGANDRFGLGLAMQGNKLMAGAFGWDVSGNQIEGAAYFYLYNGTAWVETQRLLASDREQGDNFGRQLAMDGNWVAICSPGEDGTGGVAPNAGAVYMWFYNGTVWAQMQKINAPIPQSSGAFGRGLAIKGDWLAIGEPLRVNPTAGSTGKVYLYKNISGTWTYQQEFISEVDREASGGFGFSVAMTEDMLIIGKGSGGTEVYLYKLYNETWSFFRRLFEDQRFGNTVALIDGFGASMGRFLNEDGLVYAIDFEQPSSYTRTHTADEVKPEQGFSNNLTKPTQTF